MGGSQDLTRPQSELKASLGNVVRTWLKNKKVGAGEVALGGSMCVGSLGLT